MAQSMTNSYWCEQQQELLVNWCTFWQTKAPRNKAICHANSPQNSVMASLTSSPSASVAAAEQTVEGSNGRHLNDKVGPFNLIDDFPAKKTPTEEPRHATGP
jgi:hypothetical protein